jgi:hypothetical protein
MNALRARKLSKSIDGRLPAGSAKRRSASLSRLASEAARLAAAYKDWAESSQRGDDAWRKHAKPSDSTIFYA